jgi:DNA integrity scanning protein DisA with diadenylate cyclase activity
MPFRFSLKYFLLTILLLATEILIALFVHDNIVRPYVGDMLVVILVYYFVRTFFNTPVVKTALAVLVFAFTVELLQYIDIVTKLGLQHYAFARTVIGTSFEWVDLVAYCLGVGVVILIEHNKTS